MSKAARFNLGRYWVGLGWLCASFAVVSCGKSSPPAAKTPPARPQAAEAPPPPPDPEPAPFPSPVLSLLKPGTYGGANAWVSISKRDVMFQVPCAIGHVAGPIQLEDARIFDANGTYQAMSGRRRSGPVMPARFFGTLWNGHLHFDITHSDQHGVYSDVEFDAYLNKKARFTQGCTVGVMGADSDSNADPQTDPELEPEPLASESL